jgi:hypothetical protein
MRLRGGILGMGASAFVLALAVSSAAQEEKALTTTKEKDETVRLTVTGEAELDYVWRRQEITAFTGGVSRTSVPGNSASENTFEGFVALRLNATLSDSVSAMVELGTKRVDGGTIHFFAASNGSTGSTALPIQLREANITLGELFTPELRVQMGITTWGFDLRGRGESLAFDLRHSQRFDRNVNAAADGPGTLAKRASDPEELEPVGLWLRWERTLLSLDLVALPAVIEGGSAHNDESFYAADLFYTMDSKGSRFGFIAAATKDPGGRSLVFTYGGGADWKGIESLDLYAEVYFQNGWHNGPLPGVTPIKVGGYAFQVGAEYTLPGDLNPWVGANLTYYSGDGDAVANGKSSAFLSYENVHDLLILEDMYLGFDWDTNYRAIKVSSGVALNTRRKNDLKVSAILGITQSAKTVRFPNENTHKLGNEVDAKVEWDLTKQVAINAGAGFLFGSKVLEDSMGGPNAPHAHRQSILFTIGTDLKF